MESENDRILNFNLVCNCGPIVLLEKKKEVKLRFRWFLCIIAPCSPVVAYMFAISYMLVKSFFFRSLVKHSGLWFFSIAGFRLIEVALQSRNVFWPGKSGICFFFVDFQIGSDAFSHCMSLCPLVAFELVQWSMQLHMCLLNFPSVLDSLRH